VTPSKDQQKLGNRGKEWGSEKGTETGGGSATWRCFGQNLRTVREVLTEPVVNQAGNSVIRRQTP